MTRVKVYAGICGFTSVIKVQRVERLTVRVQIISACPAMQAMNARLGEVDCTRGVFSRIRDSLIYRLAHEEVKHTDCPMPSAILKAIQVELDAALPKDVIFQITKEEEEVFSDQNNE
ncbi:DUF6951 family protein [Calderihabitans maritimus]|uniref:Uncharacterized protein n=1 Tax=Calderihabitans maritimus TaxID=1246530 RepID=A0A1Z5HNE5_9FIRM|nr:hypothetical protein [Calderihabitans maritimus]GAW91049.1 hypothetical protein Desku_0063 [Calderihabitans maritimus]